MSDTLKNRERFSTTLDKDVAKKLKMYSSETLIPISKIIDNAIIEFLQNHPTKKG